MNLPTITAPRSLSYYGAIPPLGLAYVAAAVRAAGHPLQVIDGTGDAIDHSYLRETEVGPVRVQGMRIADIVDAVEPDVELVGISLMFLHQWPFAAELARALRARHPRARIVLGGETPTAFWPQILDDCAAVDACVLGEGESTLIELLDTLAAGGELRDVPALAIRERGRALTTAPGRRVDAIDDLPLPAWDLFPVDAYLDRGHQSGVARGRSMPLLTSRGCPYQCSFCSSPRMWTTRYLRRDPARIADEIELYRQRYGITNVDLNDLTAMLTKDWVVEFCRTMIERDLGVSFQLPSGTRSEAIDAEAARLLYAAGCRNFCYAPESGAQATLRRIKKKVRLPALRESLHHAIEAGLSTHASIIVGFPHETPREMWDTYRFVIRLAVDGLHTVAVMVFAPYPGSEEYERLVAEGRIQHDDAYLYSSLFRSGSTRRSVHPSLSARQLTAIQMSMLLGFYGVQYTLRPWRIVGVAGRVWSDRQETVMDQFISTKLDQLGLSRAGLRRRAARALGRLSSRTVAARP